MPYRLRKVEYEHCSGSNCCFMSAPYQIIVGCKRRPCRLSADKRKLEMYALSQSWSTKMDADRDVLKDVQNGSYNHESQSRVWTREACDKSGWRTKHS